MTITDKHSSVLRSENTTTRGWYPAAGKRWLDLGASSMLLILASPVLALVAIGLRLQLGAGVILVQKRVGRDGQAFSMLKFRTMERSRREGTPIPVELTDDYGGPERRTHHKSHDDPRHTRLGRLVRKFSLDELPQVVNVVRGDMSLVGPRPELDDVASDAFRGHIRHTVRPGLTGPYQISELRRHGRLEAGLELDAAYATSVSLRNDLRLLAKTAGVLFRGTGS